MLDLIQRALSDDERSDAVVRLSFGIIGDLADTFPNGQLKNLLSAEWIAVELRSKARASAETKKTARWAREVGLVQLLFTKEADGVYSFSLLSGLLHEASPLVLTLGSSHSCLYPASLLSSFTLCVISCPLYHHHVYVAV
jgi:hypothetical protein